MENASKALIIAGAILISILLIAISMYIYNSASGTINNAASKMSEQEKSVYNSSVSSYIGTGKKGVDVKSLLDAIIASNNNNAGDSGKFISVKTEEFADDEDKDVVNIVLGTEEEAGLVDNDDSTVNDWSDKMSRLKSAVNMGKRYDITAKYSSGLVTMVTIKELKADKKADS